MQRPNEQWQRFSSWAINNYWPYWSGRFSGWIVCGRWMRAPGFLNAETKITMFSTKSRSKVILFNNQKSVKPFLTTILFCHILDQPYYHKMTSPSFVVILRNWQYVWCIFHSDHNLWSTVCSLNNKGSPLKKKTGPSIWALSKSLWPLPVLSNGRFGTLFMPQNILASTLTLQKSRISL